MGMFSSLAQRTFENDVGLIRKCNRTGHYQKR